MEAKTILIIGGAGFIGSHLARELVNNTKAEIAIIDDLSVGKKEFLPSNDRLTFYQQSILDENTMEEIFAKVHPDVVYHFAAKCFLPTCDKFPKETMIANVVGTEIIVRMCNKYGVNHLIFASSCAIYGISEDPLPEDRNIKPLEVYGMSKLLGEEILKNYCNVAWTACRFFPVYGDHMTQEYLIPAILNQLAKSDTLRLGNLDSKRDYVNINDVVEALRLVMYNPRAYNQALNMGYGEAFSGKELVRVISEIVKKEVKVEIDPARMRKSDNPCICADMTKTKNVLNWRPKIDLRSGLASLVNKY